MGWRKRTSGNPCPTAEKMDGKTRSLIRLRMVRLPRLSGTLPSKNRGNWTTLID